MQAVACDLSLGSLGCLSLWGSALSVSIATLGWWFRHFGSKTSRETESGEEQTMEMSSNIRGLEVTY